mgnify:CR=1 FL=1
MPIDSHIDSETKAVFYTGNYDDIDLTERFSTAKYYKSKCGDELEYFEDVKKEDVKKENVKKEEVKKEEVKTNNNSKNLYILKLIIILIILILIYYSNNKEKY